MQTRELLELAALTSCHGPLLILTSGIVQTPALDQYWTTSKCRLDRWGRALKGIGQYPASLNLSQQPAMAENAYATLEEILLSEVLTRVWTAVLVGYDQARGTQGAELIARSVYAGHLEARHRAMKLLVEGPGVNSHEALALNRVRRRAEFWSDLLVGHVASVADVSEFAVDPHRAAEFAAHLRAGGVSNAGRGQLWSLTLATLRAAFRQGIRGFSPNGDSNAQISASILACFPLDLFDATGQFASLWVHRLMTTTTDVEVRLAELFAAEDKPATRPGFPAVEDVLLPGQRRFFPDELDPRD
jgi:hypothetical protein